MNQRDRRIYLIEYLVREQSEYAGDKIPDDAIISDSDDEQKRLLRSLMNVRMPAVISDDFLKIQNEYLTEVKLEKGIISTENMEELQKDIFLWKGDITRLAVGAIVNAANSGMTGCYHPCHNCIDNCIHTYAGVQLRKECEEIMIEQGHEEATGGAKITKAYNLPCEYVIHTVGPIVQSKLTDYHREQLKSCYESCLSIADENKVKSIAFCCISTGVFMFPNEEAAKIAAKTVLDYKRKTGSHIQVVFNVFKEEDEIIYERLFKRF